MQKKAKWKEDGLSGFDLQPSALHDPNQQGGAGLPQPGRYSLLLASLAKATTLRENTRFEMQSRRQNVAGYKLAGFDSSQVHAHSSAAFDATR